MIPYSRAKRSDLYTLSQSKLLENHTLHSGTYLYSPYMAVPPPGAFTSDDFFFSPFPICVRPTIPIMFFSCVQQLEKGDFLVAKMRDKIQSAG